MDQLDFEIEVDIDMDDIPLMKQTQPNLPKLKPVKAEAKLTFSKEAIERHKAENYAKQFMKQPTVKVAEVKKTGPSMIDSNIVELANRLEKEKKTMNLKRKPESKEEKTVKSSEKSVKPAKKAKSSSSEEETKTETSSKLSSKESNGKSSNAKTSNLKTANSKDSHAKVSNGKALNGKSPTEKPKTKTATKPAPKLLNKNNYVVTSSMEDVKTAQTLKLKGFDIFDPSSKDAPISNSEMKRILEEDDSEDDAPLCQTIKKDGEKPCVQPLNSKSPTSPKSNTKPEHCFCCGQDLPNEKIFGITKHIFDLLKDDKSTPKTIKKSCKKKFDLSKKDFEQIETYVKKSIFLLNMLQEDAIDMDQDEKYRNQATKIIKEFL
jgi:hypothetical protein